MYIFNNTYAKFLQNLTFLLTHFILRGKVIVVLFPYRVMMVYIAYKFKIYLGAKQRILINKTINYNCI